MACGPVTDSVPFLQASASTAVDPLLQQLVSVYPAVARVHLEPETAQRLAQHKGEMVSIEWLLHRSVAALLETRSEDQAVALGDERTETAYRWVGATARVFVFVLGWGQPAVVCVCVCAHGSAVSCPWAT